MGFGHRNFEVEWAPQMGKGSAACPLGKRWILGDLWGRSWKGHRGHRQKPSERQD